MKVYLAGPMRGYDQFNFPAFDAAEADLATRGFEVSSPASMDRAIGFKPQLNSLEGFSLEDAVRRDTEAIIEADGVVLLPGWEKSVGATAEKAICAWLRKPCFEYPTLEKL